MPAHRRLSVLSVPGPIAGWYTSRPVLVSWVLLATGMAVLMLIFSWGAGLETRQVVALLGATLVLAWLCVWIIFLEESETPAGADPDAPAADKVHSTTRTTRPR